MVQCTERDEFAYQEMIAHLPLFCHPNPRKVLVVGGGDGGVIREVVKHDCVEMVTLCEIDERVIELSKKFLPSMSCDLNHPKVTIRVGDGMKHMESHLNEYDVIITDSSDPVGPAAQLFEVKYFELMKKALRPGGIVCSQGQCIWFEMNLVKELMKGCKALFPNVGYGFTNIPTYASGQIGFIVCSLDKDNKISGPPIRRLSDADVIKLGLKYYNSDIHSASFVLPQFAKQILDDV